MPDIDGTLVDTDAHLSACTAELFHQYGVPFTADDYFAEQSYRLPDGSTRTTRFFGATWDDVYDYLHAQHPPRDPGRTAFIAAIETRLMADRAAVTPRTEIVAAILAFNEECVREERPLFMAPVTNGKRIEAAANLKLVAQAGLEMFSAVTADEVENPKPHPEPYERQFGRLQRMARAIGHHTPGPAIAIEDSPNGATSALAAGHTCIYLQHPRYPMPAPVARKAGQLIIVHDPAQLLPALQRAAAAPVAMSALDLLRL